MIFICDRCDFQSKRENILNEHIQVDHAVAPKKIIYMCDVCEYKCESQVDFKKHFKDMHQEKKHTCCQCDFQSKRENILSEHIQVDHAAAPHKRVYVCDICEYKCESQVDFKKHCKDMHEEQKYTCDHCGTKLNSLQGLDTHIQIFHQKKPEYKCDECNLKFSVLDNVRKHMANRHGTSPGQNNQNTNSQARQFTHSGRPETRFCKYWNNSSCFSDNCKFLHEEAPPCKFQQSCRNIRNCVFFHEKQSQGFQYREEDFPPFQNSRERRQ